MAAWFRWFYDTGSMTREMAQVPGDTTIYLIELKYVDYYIFPSFCVGPQSGGVGQRANSSPTLSPGAWVASGQNCTRTDRVT